jgi:hypothetical protein
MAMTASYFSDLSRQVRFEYDKALELRPFEEGEISATINEPGIQFMSGNSDFKVVIFHNDTTGVVPTTAEWLISFQISDAMGGTYQSVKSMSLAAAGAEVEMAISAKRCEQIFPGAMYARVSATKVGTPGNLTYAAAIACL